MRNTNDHIGEIQSCAYHHHHQPGPVKDDAKTGSPKASSVGFSRRRTRAAAARRAAFTFLPRLISAPPTPLVTVERENLVLDKYILQFRQIHCEIRAAAATKKEQQRHLICCCYDTDKCGPFYSVLSIPGTFLKIPILFNWW